jgi:cell division protein FtsB
MSSRLSKIFARVVLAGFLGAAALYPGFLKLRNFNLKLESLKEEIASIEEDNLRLEEEIKALREDPFYIESHAREMGLTKEGEKVFRIKFIEDGAGED